MTRFETRPSGAGKSGRPGRPGQARSGNRREQLSILTSRILGGQSFEFYRLLGVTLFLVIFGLVMVLSSSSMDALAATGDPYKVFTRQILFAAVGLLALIAASLFSPDFYRRHAKRLFVVGIGLQLLVIFSPLGVNINGNKNWLNLGFFNVQPSEVIKLSMILFVAALMVEREAEFYDSRRFTYAILLGASTGIAVVLLGQDLGTSLVMALILFMVIFLAGVPLQHLVLPAGLSALAAIVMLNLASSRLGRITAWLNPDAPDAAGYNWQSEHGIWALAAGEIFGVGLGRSKLKWSWIPEVENDFIFAIIGEELGLIGAVVVLLLYVVLALSLYRIFVRADTPFMRYVTSGVLAWIVFQALINIAVVLRLLPVLGVPLPLISAGGTSLVMAMAAIGVVLSFERDMHLRERGLRA